MDECPLLQLQPILASSDARTLQFNFQQISDWSKRMCDYLDQLVIDLGGP